ncbi:MAG TPA: hypothetical protein VG963_18840, partial [Polyangiaceae bacterium]|nr:hypothetical protein [Polyangiaceae bacterium]
MPSPPRRALLIAAALRLAVGCTSPRFEPEVDAALAGMDAGALDGGPDAMRDAAADDAGNPDCRAREAAQEDAPEALCGASERDAASDASAPRPAWADLLEGNYAALLYVYSRDGLGSQQTARYLQLLQLAW